MKSRLPILCNLVPALRHSNPVPTLRAGTHTCRPLLLGLALLVLLPTVAEAQWRWTPQTGRFVNVKRLPKETPELQYEHARSFYVRGEYDEALIQSNRFTRYYGDSEYVDDNQFLRAEIFMAQEEYMKAARAFQQLVVNYPDSEYYDEVIEKQYNIGDTFYERGLERMDKRWRPFRKRPLKRAIDVYTMVIDNQPFTEAAAEAQYKVGLSHFSREEYVEAAFEYRRVVEDYTESDWVDDAYHDLALCYYESSMDAKYDQSPSLLTITAIDRFEERYPTDERMVELAQIRRDMREEVAEQRLLTAQYYVRRREMESARIYYEVIVKQFEGTEAYKVAEAWLDANPVKEPVVTPHTIESIRRQNAVASAAQSAS